MTTIIDGTAGVTFPAGGVGNPASAVVGLTDTQTLTNKTLTSPVINTAITGTAIATQAQQETGSATDVLVTPGRQQFHPSAAKAWIKCDYTGTISVSYNVASIADTGAGVVTVTLTTAFSSSNYVAIGNNDCGGGGLFVGASITSASVYRLLSMNTVSQGPQDSGVYFSVAFGDQ